MRRRDLDRLEAAAVTGRPLPASFDPYNDRKPYHMAKLLDEKGNVSPLCADKPRKLNLRRELWTLRPEAVTCKRCLAKLKLAPALCTVILLLTGCCTPTWWTACGGRPEPTPTPMPSPSPTPQGVR